LAQERFLLNDEHLLTPDSWSLLDCPAERADMYLIDLQGKRLVEKYVGSAAAFGFEDAPTNVTDLALSRQLEKALRQQGIRPEVLLEFIRKTIGWLVNTRKISLPTLLHLRFALEKALGEKIEAYREKAYDSGYQVRLFGEGAAVETSLKYAFAVDPDNYRATSFYHGGFKFPKHYYGEDFVGEFDNREEEECARAIEMHPNRSLSPPGGPVRQRYGSGDTPVRLPCGSINMGTTPGPLHSLAGHTP